MWDGEAISQPYFSEWETVEKFLNSVGTEPWVDCDPQRDATELPESLFRGGVYDKFCEAVDKDQEQGEIWVVDQEGYKIPPKGKRDGSSPAWVPRGLSRRAPPVDLSCYKGYIIELKWEPAKDKGACSKSCKDAMLSVSNSQCKSKKKGRRLPSTPHGSFPTARLFFTNGVVGYRWTRWGASKHHGC